MPTASRSQRPSTAPAAAMKPCSGSSWVQVSEGESFIRGSFIPGRLHIAGEWGHNQLETDGPRCYCGRCGCVGNVPLRPRAGGRLCSSRWFLRRHSRRRDSPGCRRGRDCRTDSTAFLKRFGRALAVVINILDPHAIILGGGLSNIERLYFEGREYVAQHVFWDGFDTPILKNKTGTALEFEVLPSCGLRFKHPDLTESPDHRPGIRLPDNPPAWIIRIQPVLVTPCDPGPST